MFSSFPPSLVSFPINHNEVLGFDISVSDSDIVTSLNCIAHLGEHARDEAKTFAREERIVVAHCCCRREERWRRRGLIHEKMSWSIGGDGA